MSINLDSLRALQALRDTLPEGNDAPAAEVAEPKARLPKVSIAYERKGRGGREATIICGLESLSDDDLQQLARRLKTALATGGSARGGEILLQGDRRQAARALLTQWGYR